MNYIIFGSAGFIGTHLANYIEDHYCYADNKIFRYDICARVSKDFEVLDVRKPVNNLEIPNLANSTIFNLAAVHTTPGHPNHEYFETNILGAENVCNFARLNKIETIVFTSSIAPYGASESLKEESALPMPSTPYGISKLTAEYIHKVWQAEDAKNRKLIILRPGVVFGLHEGGNFSRLYQSMRKGLFFYPGRKDTIKSAVYVKDVVRILFETAVKQPAGVTTYNLTYYPSPTIEQICNSIAEVTGLTKPTLLIPAPALLTAATTLYFTAGLLGRKNSSIHPERVKKLMISTNISGKLLSESPFRLRYSLTEGISDWFNDTGHQGLL